MHWSEIWEGSDLKYATIRAFLTPLSWLYAFGWQSYLAVYRMGLKLAKSPHSPIICVGNLTTGGTGKTPVTQAIVGLLMQSGKSVAISCSGYGSPATEEATIAPEGPLDASRWGDEAAVHRILLPDVPLIVGRNRVRAAELCRRSFPDHVLVMDDGFQHLPLAKTLSIVIDPPELKNRRCLPAGPYREPHGNLDRADIVLPRDHPYEYSSIVLKNSSGDTVEAKDVQVLCALARPDQFVESLSNAGITVTRAKFLSDHEPMTQGNLFEGFRKELPIVVTLKDWVKLATRNDLPGNLLVAYRTAKFNNETALLERLKEATK